MMASSSNLNDHLLQDDLPWPSLPLAPSIHTNGANHQWSQPLMINCDHFTQDELEVLLSAQSHHNEVLANAAPTPPQLSSVLMMQELGFQWGNYTSAHTSLLIGQEAPKIKEEELLEPLPRSSVVPSGAYTDMDGAAACVDGLPLAALEGAVLPSVNISRLKPCTAPAPFPAEAFEMLASARLCKSILSQASSVLHGSGMPLLREQMPYGSSAAARVQGPSIHNYKMAALGSGGGGVEHKACQVVVSSKKPRIESRSSAFSSFKVRKEKLGDRIAALQQLVSPFGKTDTASVLMEAIGYIKFLQDQVETLSGPYMRSSKNKKARTTQGGSHEGKDEPKLDLRSRGLCLVPLSCTSYVTNEDGVWTPPNYRGN